MSIVVTGTDTGVGKTLVCAVLLARYGRGLRLGYWKPIATGRCEGLDSDFVRRAARGLGDVLPERYAFDPPLSPHLAARLEGSAIEIDEVLAALVRHGLEEPRRSLVIEGVGGLLVPLTGSGCLLADLLREMHLPCLVVARSTLGTINHTLLTLEALRARGLELAGVVLSGPRNAENRDAVERFGRTQVVAELPPVRPLGRAGVLRAARGFDRRGRLKRFLS
ncbi:MAG: dethiobiotin synthase [Planctomycetes bacterium]|nr:dethiobiotin synthase [Planctomycetota bacterium]